MKIWQLRQPSIPHFGGIMRKIAENMIEKTSSNHHPICV